MHVDNLGQLSSDSKLGIVNQIRIASLDGFVALFQRYSAQFIGSDWQVGFDSDAATSTFLHFQFLNQSDIISIHLVRCALQRVRIVIAATPHGEQRPHNGHLPCEF
jgi:hypothetical protein